MDQEPGKALLPEVTPIAVKDGAGLVREILAPSQTTASQPAQGIISAATQLIVGNDAFRNWSAANRIGDADDGSLVGAVHQLLWNGVAFDRKPGVVRTAYLASAARTATPTVRSM